MTLELVPWRGAKVPLLAQGEISRFTTQDYLNWITWSQNYMGPPAPVTTYGSRPAEPISYSFQGFVEGMLYADGPVAAAEAYRLRVFGQAPLLYQEMVDGRAGDMFDDPALDRIRSPWAGATLSDLMKRALTYGDFAGNAFILDLDDELVLVRPDWVEIVLAKREHRGGQVGWRQVGIVYYEGGLRTSDGVAFLPGEYAHFVPGLPDPLATYRGMSWLTPLVREVKADKSAGDHKVAFFENAASPNLAVSLPKELTAAQFGDFVDKMDAQHKGAFNAYKTLYTGGGADVTVIGANMQQMDFAAVQGKGETRIANAAGVPPTLLSFSEGMQGSSLNAGNYTAAKRNFVDTTMRDLWQNFAGSVQQMDAFRPPRERSRLWYDGRDIPFLHEDALDLANIQQTRGATINAYVINGWKPETAIAAVAQDDVRVLEHTGAYSVQLQPAGSGNVNGDGQPDAEAQAADQYQQALDSFRAELDEYEDDLWRSDLEDDEIERKYYDIRVDAGHEGGGRFRRLGDIAADLLNKYLSGDGEGDDPLKQFTTTTQLRKIAEQHDIAVRPRMSVPQLKLAILDDAKARFHAGKDAKSPEAGKPVRFTLKGDVVGAGARNPNVSAKRLSDGGVRYRATADGQTTGTATVTAKPWFAERIPTGAIAIHDVKVDPEFRGRGLGRQLVEQIIADADRDGKTVALIARPLDDVTEQGRLADFYRRFGFTGPDATGLMLRKPAKPSNLRNLDVGVYTDNGKVALWEVSDSGERRKRVALVDDLKGLQQWAESNGETELATWASKEHGAGDGLDDLHVGALGDLAREHGIDAPNPAREGDRDSLLKKLRTAGITAPVDQPGPSAPIGPRKLEPADIALLQNATKPAGLRRRPEQTGAGRQHNGRIDDLRREGYVKKEVGSDHYSLTDKGREELAGWARKEQGGAGAPKVPTKAAPAAKAEPSPLAKEASAILANSNGSTYELDALLGGRSKRQLQGIADHLGIESQGNPTAVQLRERIAQELMPDGGRKPTGRFDVMRLNDILTNMSEPDVALESGHSHGARAGWTDVVSASPGKASTATAAQRDALHEYKSDERYRELDYNATDPTITGVRSAMEPLESDVVVWRGERSLNTKVPRGTWSRKGGMEGVEWTGRSFTSTSADESVARDFATNDDGSVPGSQPVLMRVRAPAGTRAVAVDSVLQRQGPDDISSYLKEQELLLADGLNYRITKDYGVVRGVRRLDVEVTPPKPAPAKVAKKAAPNSAGASGKPSRTDLATRLADEPGLHPLAARDIRESKGNTQTLRARADAHDSMAVATEGNPALANPALGLTPTGYREMARQLRSAADRIDAQSAPPREKRTFPDRPDLTAGQIQQRRVDAGFSSQPTEADVDAALDRLSRPELVELSDRLNLSEDGRRRRVGGGVESIKGWSADQLKRAIREESLGHSRRTTGATDNGAADIVDTSLDIRPAAAKAAGTDANAEAKREADAQAPDLASLRTLDARQRAVADLAAREPVSRQSLGGNAAGTEVLTYADGRQLVRKPYEGTAARLRGPNESQDAETLAPIVLDAVGLRAPAAVRGKDGAVYMEFAAGRSGHHFVAPDSINVPGEILNSDEGRLLGLADTLMGEGDRSNPGNWLKTDDGHLVPLDHGTAFMNHDTAGNQFARHFFTSSTDKYKTTNDLSQADVAMLRTRLEAARPEFVKLGRGDWHDEMMTRLDKVANGARGRRDRIAGPSAPATDLASLDTEHRRDALDLRKVDELKTMLRESGLPVSGKKRELVDRLVEHLGGGASNAPSTKAASKSSAGRAPAKPVPIHDLFKPETSDATIQAALKDVFEGKFGPYTTKADVSVTRAGTRIDKRGREHKIEPSISIGGKIYDEQGHEIGYFGRNISPVNMHYVDGTVHREVWAEHKIVQLGGGDYDANPTKYHGKGFGGEFNRRAIEWYRQSGVHGISQSDHNGYVWASQGFNFGQGGGVPDYLADNIRQLIADLRAGKTKTNAAKDEYHTIPKRFREAPDLDAQIAETETLLARLESTKPGEPDYPTAYEISQLGRRSGQRGKTALWLGKLLWVSADQMILNPDEGEVVNP